MVYEITWECPDGDWVYTRRDCEDYHIACVYALGRVESAEGNPHEKLHGARLIRIAPITGVDQHE